jgi:hypothetical protein
MKPRCGICKNYVDESEDEKHGLRRYDIR